MSLYQNEIQKLVKLQEVDNKILDLETNISELPKQLKNQQNNLAATKISLEQIQEKIDILIDQKKKLKDEIEDDGLKIEKRKNQMMQVENSKEYHAMMRELDALEKTNRLRSEEDAAILEELTEQQRLLTATQETIKEQEKEIKTNEKTLSKELASINTKLEKLQKESEQLCKDISKQMLEYYNFIKRKLPHPVVSSITNAICDTCHIKIPLQTFIEVQKTEFLITCPNCQRIIYWKELFPQTEIPDSEPQKIKVEEIE